MTAPSDARDSEILDARARALARTATQEGDHHGRELLIASLGETRVAVDVRYVRRVLPPAPLARIPAGDHFVFGLRNVGGEVLAVADFAGLLGLTSNCPIDARWIVEFDGHGGAIGVMVDRVDELVADAATRAAGVAATGVLAGTTAEGHLLIDTDALFAHPSLRVGRGEAQVTTHEEETT